MICSRGGGRTAPKRSTQVTLLVSRMATLHILQFELASNVNESFWKWHFTPAPKSPFLFTESNSLSFLLREVLQSSKIFILITLCRSEGCSSRTTTSMPCSKSTPYLLLQSGDLIRNIGAVAVWYKYKITNHQIAEVGNNRLTLASGHVQIKIEPESIEIQSLFILTKSTNVEFRFFPRNVPTSFRLLRTPIIPIHFMYIRSINGTLHSSYTIFTSIYN